MFSLLKRCKYSLYSDTMLHYWPTNQCRLERVSSISFEWKQTQMYICTLEDIYSGRCSHIAVHVVSELLNGILTGLYTLAIIGRERMRKLLDHN